MVRVLVSTVVAAVILFFWGFLAWSVLPMHKTSGGAFEDEAAVAEVLNANAQVSGVYMLPYPPDEGADEAAKDAWEEAHKAGPRALVAVNLSGSDPMAPTVFLIGLATNIVTGLVLSVLLVWARNIPGGYLARVVLIVGIGFVVGLEADLKYWNWLYVPWDWSIMNVLDHVIGFGAAGLAMAAIIRPSDAAKGSDS